MKNSKLAPSNFLLKTKPQAKFQLGRLLLSFILLVFFTITSFNKIKGQSPCAGAVNIYSCDANVTLYSTALGGSYTYDWYDDHCAPGSLCTSPTYLTTVDNYSNTFADGEYYFHYDAINGGVVCSSGSIHLTVATGFDITPLTGGLPLTMTLDVTTDPNVALMGYTNFQWFRNGIPIVGAIYDTYTAYLPGPYHLTAYSPNCSNKASLHVVPAGCSLSNTYSNYNFLTNTTLSGSTIVFDGTITIMGDATLTLSNCNIVMTAGSEIIVKKANTGLGQTHGGNLQIANCKIGSCTKWGGIYADGYDYSTANNAYSATVSITYSEIHDAYIGLFADNNAKLTINHNIFENNYQHIDLRSFAGEKTGCAGGGNQGVNLYIEYNTFNFLMETMPVFTPTNLPSTPNNNSYRKMIYIDDCKTIALVGNYFSCFNWSNAFDENAIEVYNVSPEICTIPGFQVNLCYFIGDFNDAMFFSNIEDVSLYHSTVVGNPNHGIEIFGGDRVDIELNGILNNTTQGGVSGINLSQVNNLTMAHDTVSSFLKGIEYYNYKSNCVGQMTENSIEYNRYGLVIAPECDPTASSLACNNNYNNNYNNLRKLNYSCNKFFYNDWGVVGVGDIDPQGGSASTEWENFFHYSPGYTTSYNSDIAWYNQGNNVDIYYYTGYNPLWPGSSISLDGNTVSSFTNQVNIATGPSGSCRGTFKTQLGIDLAAKLSSQSKTINMFPNPANDYIVLENDYESTMGFNILDMTGKQVMTGNVRGKSKLQFDIRELPIGCYLIRVFDCIDKTPMFSQKLIKVN